jgi:hypothetical protein
MSTSQLVKFILYNSQNFIPTFIISMILSHFFADLKSLIPSVLFSVKSIAKESEFVPGSRDLFVGCVRTMAVSQKKASIGIHYMTHRE